MLPNLLVDGIRRAIEVSPALKVYVCNVATQHGETDAFSVSDHYDALREHLKGTACSTSCWRTATPTACCPRSGTRSRCASTASNLDGARVVKADVVAEENRYRHDSKKLADALIRLYYERHQMADAEPIAVELEREAQHAGVG